MTQTLWKAGNDMIRDTRYSVVAAMSLLVAGVTFFVAEAITASAWDNPAYNYAADFVSDLGVPGPSTQFGGHLVHSPLALVMNTAFVVNGALVVLAAFLLLPPGGEGRLPRWLRWFVIAYGLGLFIIAPLHESPAWMLPFHAFGTTLCVASGNIATFLTGRLGPRLGLPPWLARAFMGLGTIGFAFLVVVQVLATVDTAALPNYIGTAERLAVYPLPLVQLVAGVGLAIESTRMRRRNLALVP